MRFCTTLALCFICLSTSTTQAMVTTTGYVTPSDFSAWDESTQVVIGKTSDGIVTVNGGSELLSYSTYLGDQLDATGTATISGVGTSWSNRYGFIVGYYGNGIVSVTGGGKVSGSATLGFVRNSAGTVTVSGSGSTWDSSDRFDIGCSGTGHVNITDGGVINVANHTWLGREEDSVGTIYFYSGTLVTGGLCAGASELTGTGTIYTNGLVSDVDLLFDATHGNSKTFVLNSLPDQNITIHLEQGSDTALGAGYTGNGSLTIKDGITMDSVGGYFGYKTGSKGIGTISGDGSTWNITDHLLVGRCGTGHLDITDGAVVNVSGQTLLAGPNAWPYWPGPTERGAGSIHFDSGTLHTSGLCAGAAELTGTGIIYTTYLFSDIDLVFDATHGTSQTITLNDLPGQNITIHLEQSDLVPVAGAGYRGNGSLTVKDGRTLESTSGYLGYHAGSSGTATISGSGSTWTNQVHFSVGDRGQGVLSILAGGMVESGGTIAKEVGAEGTVNVSGAGSTWKTWGALVGNFGNGALNITDGGTVISNNGGSIGVETSAMGKVLVSGDDSTWDLTEGNETFNIGDYGAGELNIQNGGCVISNWSNIGASAGSSGKVTVSGSSSGTPSRWMSRYSIVVGKQGNGELNITDGGFVDCLGGYVGYGADSIGTVNVSGNQSLFLINNCVSIGYNGIGYLNVLDGGQMHASQSIILGENVGSHGTAKVSGSGAVLSGYYFIGGSGTGRLDILNGGTFDGSLSIGEVTGSNGTVNISGDGSVCSGRVYVANRGTGKLRVSNSGKIDSSNFKIGFYQNSNGIVYIEGSGATLTIKDPDHDNAMLYVGYYGAGELNIFDGGLVSVDGILKIDENGDHDSFINMSDGGMLALAGANADSLEDFLGSIQGTDAIRWWDTSIGDWALLETATLGTDYTLEYLMEGDLLGYTLLTVTAAGPIPGDANGDGMVDGSDVTILANNWQVGVNDGEIATRAMGDFNNDGKVDGSDVTILASNWQRNVTNVASAVPEPGGSVLIITAFLSMGILSRFRK